MNRSLWILAAFLLSMGLTGQSRAVPRGGPCGFSNCFHDKGNRAAEDWESCVKGCISHDKREFLACAGWCYVIWASTGAQNASDCSCDPGTSCVNGACQCDPCQPGRGLVLDPATCSCECPAGQVMCPSGACGNPANCNLCPAGTAACKGACVGCSGGQVVDQSTCSCACPAITCGDGMHQDPTACTCVADPPCASCPGTCCNGACVDTSSDGNNCGACGTMCTGGRACRSGSCVCSGNTPDSCNGVCTNFKYDPGNCGGCSSGPNGSLFVCSGSPSGPSCCPSSLGGLCTDVSVDGLNCGACGVSCKGGKKCQSGSCECPSSLPPAVAPLHNTVCPGKCIDPYSSTCVDCSKCPIGPGACIQNETCQVCGNGGSCEPRNDGLQCCGTCAPACVDGTFPCTLASGLSTCCTCGGL